MSSSRPPASKLDALRQVYIPSRTAWRRWLSKNQRAPEGIWLVYDKKGHGDGTLTYDAIVEEALCYGWIDSRPRKLSPARSMLLITPRKPGSVWSKLNKERIARLEAAGLMTSAGRVLVEKAKKDGSWEALTAVDAMEMPADLARALKSDKPAARHFDAFPPSSKRIILGWIASAKRPETRTARVAETVRMAAKNLRANHYRQAGSRGGR
jgi:uncharacterized protein YdeI (YjbR/CyaY-like superfamily)